MKIIENHWCSKDAVWKSMMGSNNIKFNKKQWENHFKLRKTKNKNNKKKTIGDPEQKQWKQWNPLKINKKQ